MIALFGLQWFPAGKEAVILWRLIALYPVGVGLGALVIGAGLRLHGSRETADDFGQRDAGYRSGHVGDNDRVVELGLRAVHHWTRAGVAVTCVPRHWKTRPNIINVCCPRVRPAWATGSVARTA